MLTPSGHEIEDPTGERDTIARATRKQLEARLMLQFAEGVATITNLMGKSETWVCVSGNHRSADSRWELKERGKP